MCMYAACAAWEKAIAIDNIHCMHVHLRLHLHLRLPHAPRLQAITPSVRPWVLMCFPGDRVALEP